MSVSGKFDLNPKTVFSSSRLRSPFFYKKSTDDIYLLMQNCSLSFSVSYVLYVL